MSFDGRGVKKTEPHKETLLTVYLILLIAFLNLLYI